MPTRCSSASVSVQRPATATTGTVRSWAAAARATPTGALPCIVWAFYRGEPGGEHDRDDRHRQVQQGGQLGSGERAQDRRASQTDQRPWHRRGAATTPRGAGDLLPLA